MLAGADQVERVEMRGAALALVGLPPKSSRRQALA